MHNSNDLHGPTYPGDLIIIDHTLVYQSISLKEIDSYGQEYDLPKILVDIGNDPPKIGIIVSSVRGVGTWKCVLIPNAYGWIPWMSYKILQQSPIIPCIF